MASSCSEASSISLGVAGVATEKHSEDNHSMVHAASTSKHVRPIVNERSAWSKLDVGLWSSLDDHLVEKIIARLPFKSLFQASSLSKTWWRRFLSESFQSEVHSSTSSWKSYSPLFVNHKKELVGYESCSKRWHRLPTHSYLAEAVVQDWCLRAGSGSLLCWTSADRFGLYSYPPPYHYYTEKYQVHVSNPLTKTSKQLPERPDMLFPEVVHVVCHGSKSYQVILLSLKTLRGRGSICVQIFDSTSDSWTEGSYTTGTSLDEWGGSAHINGVIYLLGRRSGYYLISFDVKEKVWKEIPQLCQVNVEDFNANLDQKPHQHLRFYDVRFSQVIVCGLNVMLVVLHRDKVSIMDFEFDDSSDDEEANSVSRETLSVFRLDLESGLAFEVSRAPNEMLAVADLCSAAGGQDDCIYIGGRFPSCRSILYNVVAEEWHWVPAATDSLRSFRDHRMTMWLWTSTTYQPGLNLFLEV